MNCEILSWYVFNLITACKLNFQFLVLIMEKLGTLIDDAEWRSVQLLIRFLADLINCNVVLGASLLGLFDTFIATAAQPGVKPVSLQLLNF